MTNREDYLRHRQKRLDWQQRYRAENPEKVRASKKASYQKHQQATIQKIIARTKSRLEVDVAFRVSHNLRSRVSKFLTGKSKSACTLELLGMSLPEFRIYIQGQFRPGMSWENYGLIWHLDHIRPCAKFDLTDPAQQRECFHWSNLQPLFASENLSKGAKF